MVNFCDNFTPNEKRVLQLIYHAKRLTRSDIVQQTSISITSVTKFVMKMINLGIVIEGGSIKSARGRKSTFLSINPEFAYCIAIDLGGWSTKIGVVRMDGSILQKEIIRTDDKVPAFGFDIDSLSVKIADLLAQYPEKRFLGICISVSGMVDVQRGKIIFCPNIRGWNNVDVVNLLRNRFNLPVYLDTSPRCMAMAEQWFGAGRSIKNQFFISLGTYSIGAGLIIDSNLYRGSFGFSGELGHVQVEENGELCTCGKSGCLETSSSLSMIMQHIQQKIEPFVGYSPLKARINDVSEIDLDVIKQALQEGDRIVTNELNLAARHVGIAVSNIVNVLNPELVVIGGGVIENFPIMLDKIRETIYENSLVSTFQNLTIQKSQLGQDATLIGNAIQAIDAFLYTY